MQPSHQIAGVDVQGTSDAQDVVEAEVALTALDLADERPVQFGLVGQSLLGQPQLLAPDAHPCPELAGCWRDGRLGRGSGHLVIPAIPTSRVQRLCISSKYVLCCRS